MARVQVQYNYSKLDSNGIFSRPETLCFVCAVKAAAIVDPKKAKIVLETTEYQSSECTQCGNFLVDTITI